MDYADQVSGIDDSFQSVYGQPAPEGRSVTHDNRGYNGPRSGHWTVKSTVLGSGIDDAVPTVHDFGNLRDDESPGRVQPVPGSVLRKLARATEEEERKKKAEEARKASYEKESVADYGVKKQAKAEPEKPKKFYLPKFDDHHVIRIKGADGRTQVMRSPSLPPAPALKADALRRDHARSTRSQSVRATSPQPSVRTDKGGSTTSRASHQTTRMVRIVSKEGDEVLMEVPALGGSFSRALSEVKAGQQAKPVENTPVKNEKQERAQRDAKAAKAAKELREERARAERAAAAEIKMSGALPAPSNASSASKRTPAQSAPSEYTASKAPSVASSRTSVPKAVSVKAAPKEAAKPRKEQTKAPSPAGWQEVGSALYEPQASRSASRGPKTQTTLATAASTKPSEPSPADPFRNAHSVEDARYEPVASMASLHLSQRTANAAPPPLDPYRNAGFVEDFNYEPAGTMSSLHQGRRTASTASQHVDPFRNRAFVENSKYEPAGSIASSHPSRSAASAQPHQIDPFRNAAFVEDARYEPAGTIASLHPSHPSYRAPSAAPQPYQQFEQPANHPPTVFAGRGWISPHPLSNPPSEYREGPQAAIRLPGGNGIGGPATMTYDEWRAMQVASEKTESVLRSHRNFSRTSSGVEGRQGGRWGYASATVESVQSGQSGPGGQSVPSGSQVRLMMPWDGDEDANGDANRGNENGNEVRDMFGDAFW
ncbi:hypothetical protein LTR37_016865 [Vermiconidia calcicola]|uniref:Uncharacterized protein n=1 Tax=Vermiconidia calcicola TaxID=1690605 RepID=A0ACC3MLR1_9PEZI|nr:hypothetical protein LTR37_016865 [Vermiconidia calcicola]